MKYKACLISFSGVGNLAGWLDLLFFFSQPPLHIIF